MRAKRGQMEAMKIAKTTIFLYSMEGVLVHRFPAKALIEMVGKMMGMASSGKDRREPEMDHVRATYIMKNERFGFSVRAFKAAAVRGAKATNIMPMTDARSAFFIHGEKIKTPLGQDELIELVGVPMMHMAPVRNDGGSTDVRFRALFNEWAVALPIEFNAALISIEQLSQMFTAAGWGNGIGEDRRQKGGNLGAFRLCPESEYNALKKRSDPERREWFKRNASNIQRLAKEEARLYDLIMSDPDALAASVKVVEKIKKMRESNEAVNE